MRLILIFLIFVSALEAKKDIKVQLRWKHQFQFAGYYMALHKGFYEDINLNVELLEGDEKIDVVKTVLSKKADFGISNSSLILDYMKGLDVLNLGAIFQHSPNILLTTKDFKSPVDLARDGKIALMGGDQDIELKAMFSKEGIDLSKVKFVTNENYFENFIEGKIEAINSYISNEPFVLNQKGLDFKIIDPRDYGLDFYGDTLFTSKLFYNNNYETVSAFRTATLKGWEYALENIEESVDVILKYYNTQNKSKEALIYEANTLKKLINNDLVEIGHINRGRWENIALVYKDLGLVKSLSKFDDFFYIENKKVDLTWFYIYFFISSFSIFIILGIVYYIYKINKKLLKSEKRHKILFQNSASAGLVWKKDYIITEWNEQATKLFGWSASEVIGKSFLDFLIPQDEKFKFDDGLKAIFDDNNLHIFINKNCKKDKSIIICEWYNTKLQSTTDNSSEVVSLAIDITKRFEDEQTLKLQANNDFLTKLPNRLFFENILQKVYLYSKRNSTIFGLAIIDLDGFKAINDIYGHYAGDALLQEISLRFQDCIRAEDTIARIGGDEFAFIFHIGTIKEPYEKIIDRLLQEASKIVVFDGNIKLQVSASIGISFYSKDNDVDTKTLQKQADQAMYLSKTKGKNCFTVFDT
ncbi:ABC transporter substrate-binding protein [Aliarcobacter cryaerophilus]|uniref:ABC transporter substrate-binding protein n=1 Tax=Aliarcobacter cryaerophilus TaxID=28198 RepID=UPI0021B5EFA9|nr:ABC transporter substrate-binding protein [Aliarcobacter cryaerophilus]MCT7487150.1 ABC transporter substrate-binding protein [Aliarcobacter cryaerophilus]MCT7491756.1 ABC transporter substrate-binding protein [Aliarcobacter cryaerophilus]